MASDHQTLGHLARRPPPYLASFLCLALLLAACTSSDESDAALTASTSISDQTTTTPVLTLPPPPVPEWSIDDVLGADPNCATPAAGVPFRIGYAADLGEPDSTQDVSGTEAALHLARLINCSGGVDGQPVEILVVDVSGSPLASRTAVRELVDGGVSAIIGPPSPDPGFRVLQETGGEIPVVFAGSTEPALADLTDLSFLVAFDDTRGASSAAQFALDQGWRTAATFSSPGPYFGYNPAVFTEVFVAGGGTVIADYNFTSGQTDDFSTEATELAAVGSPDVIYSPMTADQVSTLRVQLAAAGVGSEFIASDAFEATGGYDIENVENVEGVYHTTHASPEPGNRASLLGSSFQLETGQDLQSQTHGALAADAVTVILDAYLRSGKGSPDAIGEAIAEGANLQGVTGLLSYDGQASPDKPVYIHRVVGGQPTLAAVIGS